MGGQSKKLSMFNFLWVLYRGIDFKNTMITMCKIDMITYTLG